MTLVVFVFLGSLRSVAHPDGRHSAVAGRHASSMMLALGFSINLLTLLALVLAIGLVVDDAIIVVENVNRHLEEGMRADRRRASLAARELGGPIIAMTVVLVAVYVPIGFQGGLTGALFTEFAFTLVGAVTVSGVVALTLSPMLCSRLLKPPRSGAAAAGRTRLRRLHRPQLRPRCAARYERWLHGSLNYLPVTAGVRRHRAGSIYFLLHRRQERAGAAGGPGRHHHRSRSRAPNATLQQRQLYSRAGLRDLRRAIRRPSTSSRSTCPGQSIAGMVFKPWDERTQTTNTAAADRAAGARQDRRRARRRVPAAAAAGQHRPAGAVRHRHHRSVRAAQRRRAAVPAGGAARAACSSSSTTDLKIDNPQSTVDHRPRQDRAARPQDERRRRRARRDARRRLRQLFQPRRPLLQGDPAGAAALPAQYRTSCSTITSAPPTARSVPLSTIATITTKTVPESLNHFQQLNSADHPGRGHAGRGAGRRAAIICKDLAARTLPQGYSVDYGGLSRQYVQESSGFIATFGFALIIIFLALAALFESFRDPLIILVSVPMSIAGALIFISARHRRRQPQHLHRGRAGDADGPHQQARHPDRRSSPTTCSSRASPSARRSRRPPASGCGRS